MVFESNRWLAWNTDCKYHSRLAPCKRIRNPANLCCWNPESTMVWNPESTLVWNPESRRLESGIQRIEIQNPDAGIRNLEAGIRNPGPSWILLHRATRLAHFQRKIKWRLLGALRYYEWDSSFTRCCQKSHARVPPGTKEHPVRNWRKWMFPGSFSNFLFILGSGTDAIMQ